MGKKNRIFHRHNLQNKAEEGCYLTQDNTYTESHCDSHIFEKEKITLQLWCIKSHCEIQETITFYFLTILTTKCHKLKEYLSNTLFLPQKPH